MSRFHRLVGSSNACNELVVSLECLWQSSSDVDNSPTEVAATIISKSKRSFDLEPRAYLPGRRRAINERRLQALETLKVVAMYMTEETRQWGRSILEFTEIVD